MPPFRGGVGNNVHMDGADFGLALPNDEPTDAAGSVTSIEVPQVDELGCDRVG